MLGLKRKEHKYKKILQKLINKEDLNEEEVEFLKKQGIKIAR